MKDTKFKQGQKVFLSIEGWITAHTIKWYMENDNKTFYLVIITWQIKLLESTNLYATLEEAKKVSIEFINKVIEDKNWLIKEVEEAETIELSSELTPQEEQIKKMKEEKALENKEK